MRLKWLPNQPHPPAGTHPPPEPGSPRREQPQTPTRNQNPTPATAPATGASAAAPPIVAIGPGPGPGSGSGSGNSSRDSAIAVTATAGTTPPIVAALTAATGQGPKTTSIGAAAPPIAAALTAAIGSGPNCGVSCDDVNGSGRRTGVACKASERPVHAVAARITTRRCPGGAGTGDAGRLRESAVGRLWVSGAARFGAGTESLCRMRRSFSAWRRRKPHSRRRSC
jgi:hypothetical protein